MGSSIAACQLASGHPVIGIEADAARRSRARRRVLDLLRETVGGWMALR